ncbi:MAG TPA: molybdate ABC transporter substrate-binding protein [Alphaproteobacteria bacterium]|nr:molybdate ABC transporter substrate-binding protein [Alphaproteobacteria bacterium]HAJ48171.1 molybdate ABC transporter substrate-binding protein [Alphaproteobacteria bacterium]
MGRAAILLGLTIWLAAVSGASAKDAVLVFAAASLKGPLDEVVSLHEKNHGVPVKVSYAGTPALARQIAQGARAAIFISADHQWMDYLDKEGFLEPGTRTNLLRNRLVLVAGPKGPAALKLAPSFPLAAALGSGRLALADPDSVPAGRYARAALTTLQVWEQVAHKTVRAENVRAAMAYVARGEAPLGIVYATDARQEPRVRVLDTFPEGTHPPIVYPAALVKGASPAARVLLQELLAPQSIAQFKRAGFLAP